METADGLCLRVRRSAPWSRFLLLGGENLPLGASPPCPARPSPCPPLEDPDQGVREQGIGWTRLTQLTPFGTCLYLHYSIATETTTFAIISSIY